MLILRQIRPQFRLLPLFYKGTACLPWMNRQLWHPPLGPGFAVEMPLTAFKYLVHCLSSLFVTRKSGSYLPLFLFWSAGARHPEIVCRGFLPFFCLKRSHLLERIPFRMMSLQNAPSATPFFS
jgi:hypothetical protein